MTILLMKLYGWVGWAMAEAGFLALSKVCEQSPGSIEWNAGEYKSKISKIQL